MSILSKLAMSLALAGAAAVVAPPVADACGAYSPWTWRDAVRHAAIYDLGEGGSAGATITVRAIAGTEAEVEVRWAGADHDVVQLRTYRLAADADGTDPGAWTLGTFTYSVLVAKGAPYPGGRLVKATKTTKKAKASDRPTRAGAAR